jgi:hypothetical protein
MYTAYYPQFYLTTVIEQADACEGDPCDPVNGTHRQTEVDIIPRDNSMGFYRHYSSMGLQNKSSFMGSHWRHNFSQKIGSHRDKQANNLIKSGLYATKELACTSGWNSIKTKAYRGLASTGVASYANGLCEISLNGTPVALLVARPCFL